LLTYTLPSNFIDWNSVSNSHLFKTCCMSRSFGPSWLDYCNTWQEVKVTKFRTLFSDPLNSERYLKRQVKLKLCVF
jgi:hypothetical protein